MLPREREYVVSAASDQPVAVVRHLRGHHGVVPSWACQESSASDGAAMGTCSVVIGEPEHGNGLVIATSGRWGYPYAHVWAGPGRALGLVHRGARTRLRFSACRCGRRPRACVCGVTAGRVRKPVLRRGPWSVVDGSGTEIAVVSARPRPDPGPLARAWEEHGVVGGSIRTVGHALRAAPAACDVRPQQPGFSWDEWGLVVALAALCDPRLAQRALPRGGG